MSDTVRSVLVILVIIVVFILSYLAFSKLDNSYMLNKPEYVKKAEAVQDSLKKVIKELKEKADEK